MTKTRIEAYLETLEHWFVTDKPRYDNEVSIFQEFTRCCFDNALPPHVFSGKIDRAKIVFVTLNPKDRTDGLSNRKPMGASYAKQNFLHLYNRIGGGIATFERMNQMAARILGRNTDWTYNVLHDSCVDIDFVPFYSTASAFSIDTSHPQFKKQLQLLEEYVKYINACSVILIGKSLSALFDAIVGAHSTFYPYLKPIGKLKKPGITLKEIGPTTIALVSHSLTAFGMVEDFYKNFIPSIVRC